MEERARIEKLCLANEHALLIFKAVTGKKDIDSLKLLAFREKHNIPPLPWNEQYFGDVCGVKRVMNFKEYLPPYLKTPQLWNFRLDPEDKGIEEKWFEHTPVQVHAWEAVMSTNSPWETPDAQCVQISDFIREKTAKYDGIAWYGTQIRIPEDWKNREIFLYFGAVDESCWLYVNGKEAGCRIHWKPNDWSSVPSD
ncbi:MAG: hypothetical protein IJJ33_13845 [Victivallales bacterium]|nr:hypothetical protein [Victivallales bacterium]